MSDGAAKLEAEPLRLGASMAVVSGREEYEEKAPCLIEVADPSIAIVLPFADAVALRAGGAYQRHRRS
jgi:hypothetical protein